MKRSNAVLLGLLTLIVVLAIACQPVVEADQGKSENTAAQVSGNGYFDPNMYTLKVQIGGESKDHTELHAEGSSFTYNGYGSGSLVVWQDGKGLVPAKIVEMEPETPLFGVGSYVILKTEDLKASALREGWVVEIKCRMDYEPLRGLGVPNEKVDAALTQTWELDLCRMTTPEFEVLATVTPAE